jgi:hypothetical protein
MNDPRTGAALYARYAVLPNAPKDTLLPRRPNPRTLKCIWDGTKSFHYVHRLLGRILRKRGLYDSLDYFSPNSNYSDSIPHDTLWGDLWCFRGKCYRWIACFAVTGASEGHYIHVDLIGTQGPHDAADARLNLFLGKTLDGMERACEIATLLAHLLGA